MGLRVYWELCRKFGEKCAERWFEEVSDEMRTSEDGKVENGGTGQLKPQNNWKIIIQIWW